MSLWTFLNSEITLVLMGFVFTTVAGTMLARRLENGAWKRQTQVELFRRRYDDGCMLLDSLSTLIGARSFALQRLAWALPSGEEARIKQLEVENSRMVVVWNKHRYNYRNKIRLLIGEPQANAFLDYRDDFHPESPESVHYMFVRAHHVVMQARKGNVPADEAQQALDALNVMCTDFLESLTTEFAERATELKLLRLPGQQPAASAEGRPAFFDISAWLRTGRTARPEPTRGAPSGEESARVVARR